MIYAINVLLRLVLATGLVGFVTLHLGFPETVEEIALAVDGSGFTSFTDVGLIGLVASGVILLLDSLGMVFMTAGTSPDDEKLTFVQRLLDTEAPRWSRVRGLIRESDWGKYLAKISTAKFGGRAPKAVFVNDPPDEKGIATVVLTVTVDGASPASNLPSFSIDGSGGAPAEVWKQSRSYSAKNPRTVARLQRESKIVLMHTFITSALQSDAIEPADLSAEQEPAATAAE